MDFTPGPATPGNALTLAGDVSVDATDWLPPGAAEKLRNLRQRSADLHGAIPNFEKRQEANLAKTECVNRLSRLMAHSTEMRGSGFGFNLSPDDPRVLAEQKKLDGLTKAAERINALYETRSSEWNAASVEAWLKQGRPSGTMLVDYTGEPPKPRIGETLLDGIARFRKKISELQAEISDIERAPLPGSYCRQKAKAQIEVLAARGRPDARALVAGSLDVVQFATERHSHNLTGFDIKGKPVAGVASWEQPDILGLFAHVHAQALLKAVDAVIGAEADDAKAMAPEARERTLADIRAKLLDTTRAECTLVWAALDQKLPIEFRADADPRAVLAVELIAAPATAAAAGMHTFEIVGP